MLVLVVMAFGFLAYALGFLEEYLIGLAVVPVLLWIRFTKTAPDVLQARFLGSRAVAAWIMEAARAGEP